MATSKITEQVETKTEAAEDTQQEEIQQEAISDRRLILAPLARYGLVAIVVSGIIVATAIMVNKEYNQIDEHVAAIEAELEQKNLAEQVAVQETTQNETISEVVEVAEVEVTEVIPSNNQVYPLSTSTEAIKTVAATAPVTTTPVPTAPVTTTEPQMVSKAFDHKARIAEHNEFMAQQDQKHLESFKASQAKQIEMLRAQLVKQQERIAAIEKRNKESYEMREAAIKRMQEARKETLNRI